MNITVKNFRGVARAELMLVRGRTTLIAGANGAGKTSCAQAVAAAFSGEMPVEGVKKSEAGVLVRAGAVKGSIEVDCDGEGTIAVSYPSGKVTTTGAPATASVYALGMVDLTRLEPKKAAAVLLDYLKATPTRDDLVAALALQEFTPEQHAALWRDVENLGWDGAEKLWREKGQRLKGRWETIAGERYGPAKAETWAPAKWTTGLEGASEESLTAVLTQAREFHEAAIADCAVSDERRADLTARASKLDELIAAHEAAVDAHASASAFEQLARDSYAKLPQPSREETTTPCPHCSQPVVMRSGGLHKPAERDAAADAAKADALASASKIHRDAAVAKGKARDEVGVRMHAVLDARKAVADLAALPAASGTAASDLERTREAVRRAEEDLQCFRAQRDAKATHRSIFTNDAVIEQLKPEGLRLKKLRNAVDNFNNALSSICHHAGWGRVRVDEGLTFSYDDRALPLVSASQRFRAAVVVQVALARLDQSAVVVVDAADILDTAGRNGLVKMLRVAGIASLVCMTMKHNDVPLNGGLSYWLEGAESHQVKKGPQQ